MLIKVLNSCGWSYFHYFCIEKYRHFTSEIRYKQFMRFKLFVFAIFATFTIAAQAQSTKTDTVADTSLKFRGEIGYVQTYRYGDYIVKSLYHTPRVGLNVEIPLRNRFAIETGLKYSFGIGKREQLYPQADTAFFKYSGHFLDVPVRVTYTLPIFWGLKIFGYAGPNFNIGLTQTSETKFTPKKPETTDLANYPIPGTNDLYNTEMNRISLQLGAGGGVQWKNYRLRSGYDWGINNTGKNKDRPERLRGWHVAFEYEF